MNNHNVIFPPNQMDNLGGSKETILSGTGDAVAGHRTLCIGDMDGDT